MVQSKIPFIFNKKDASRSGKLNAKKVRIFRWNHSSHCVVPKKWKGSHVDIPSYSCGIWTSFLVNVVFVPIIVYFSPNQICKQELVRTEDPLGPNRNQKEKQLTAKRSRSWFRFRNGLVENSDASFLEQRRAKTSNADGSFLTRDWTLLYVRPYQLLSLFYQMILWRKWMTMKKMKKKKKRRRRRKMKKKEGTNPQIFSQTSLTFPFFLSFSLPTFLSNLSLFLSAQKIYYF